VFSKSVPITAATTLNGPTFTLEWDASPYADRYEVCLSTSSRCRSWTSVTGTDYTTPVLRANTRYYWQVRAVNSAGRTDAGGGVWSFITPS
jgi:hypothetical protein